MRPLFRPPFRPPLFGRKKDASPGMGVLVKKRPPSERQLREWDEPHPFLEAGPMSTAHTRKRSSRRQPSPSLGKPRGVLHPRVQQVGPEHFGIVCFDCHKGSSKFLLADFYGKVLLPPTVVAHN